MFRGLCGSVRRLRQGLLPAPTFKVVLELSEEGGYTVYVPALLGCLSKGDTVEEALQNIREAIQLYLEPVEEPEKFLDLL